MKRDFYQLLTIFYGIMITSLSAGAIALLERKGQITFGNLFFLLLMLTVGLTIVKIANKGINIKS